MRLIDADKLENIIESAYNAFADESPENVHKSIGATLNIVREMPTIEAEPVRHGKWLLDGCCEIQCSCCDETYSDEIFMMRGGINYCPNCGAKMDGGNENA